MMIHLPTYVSIHSILPSMHVCIGGVSLRPGDGIIHSWLNRMLLPDTLGTGGDSHTRFPIGRMMMMMMMIIMSVMIVIIRSVMIIMSMMMMIIMSMMMIIMSMMMVMMGIDEYGKKRMVISLEYHDDWYQYHLPIFSRNVIPGRVRTCCFRSSYWNHATRHA